MSFIAQDFEKLDIITVLEGRTQAVIRMLKSFLNAFTLCNILAVL
ncbi:transposase [Streptococcus pneumoniae]|nr:transposase [Streptococcus pneumoniae]VRS60607.1 transposase [Streptococcus pneumoniae]